MSEDDLAERARQLATVTGTVPARISSASGQGVRPTLFSLQQIIDGAKDEEQVETAKTEPSAKWQPEL